VNNVEHLSTPFFGQLAGSLDGTDCGKLFQAGLTTSGQGATPGQSLSDFLTNILPSITGHGDFVDGDSNAVEGNGYAVGYMMLFNNTGAFFKAIPQGQSIGYSNDYTSQFAAIQGGSGQAQAFLMLHELGHLFGMIRSDATSTANQAFNNDEIWRNCSSVIQGFSNQGH
jgi:hypothetical protein